MDNNDLLEEYGWITECESPFEIRHENGSFATKSGACCVLELIPLSKFINNILVVKNAYQADLINKDMFVDKVIHYLNEL